MQGLSSSISSILPIIFGVVLFTVYEATNDRKLTTPQIYSLITLFNSFVSPIRFFLMSILNKADAKAAASRINSLFSIDSVEPLEDNKDIPLGTIQITDGEFNYEDAKYYKIFEKKELKTEDQSLKILQNINLNVVSGQFVAVVGKVGSGKSSLLLASINEMVTQKGVVTKNGKVAYIQQEAFLLNDTIKQNILFGEQEDSDWLNKVLDICQLRPDLEMLSGGL